MMEVEFFNHMLNEPECPECDGDTDICDNCDDGVVHNTWTDYKVFLYQCDGCFRKWDG